MTSSWVHCTTISAAYLFNLNVGFCIRFDILGEYVGLVVDCRVSPPSRFLATLVNEDGSEGAGASNRSCLNLGVDAQDSGNELRFINSFRGIASTPNVVMRTGYLNSYPHIILVCGRDIQPGDEILLDYGSDYDNKYILAQQPPAPPAGPPG